MNQTWMLGPEAIHEVGLLGERTVDGVCVTNVPLIGLSENHRGPPEWGRQSHRAMLLALSAVHYFFDIPDVRIAPMAPYLTNRFRQIDNPWIVLADGTVIRKDLVTVAQLFGEKFIFSAPDPDSLTLAASSIIQGCREIVRNRWPDNHTVSRQRK